MIIYTWPEYFKDESNVLNDLLKSGMESIHIYKKNRDFQKMKSLIVSIPEKYHKNLVLHSNYELASEFNLLGIHYSRNLLKKNENIIDKNLCWRSVSIHNIDEIDRIPENINYIVVSPVFKSISKPGHYVNWDYKLLSEKIKASNYKFIALGGISPENYYELKKMGFYDIAFLGSFWNEYFDQFSINKMKNFFKILNSHETSMLLKYK